MFEIQENEGAFGVAEVVGLGRDHGDADVASLLLAARHVVHSYCLVSR